MRETNMASKSFEPIPYGSQTEHIADDEADDIRRVLDALKRILEESFARTGKHQSDVHVKSDGCASGVFEILAHLPAELAQGLFQDAGIYSATVRFSNGAGQENPDWMPDGRGLAIKIDGCRGERLRAGPTVMGTQDFVMVNHPVFIGRNVKDYLRLENLIAESARRPLSTIGEGLTGGNWNPLAWHWREAVTAAQIAAKVPAHPASNSYFSMSPIRYGKFVAKYRVVPQSHKDGSLVGVLQKLSTATGALRLMLEETLRSQEVTFEFQVQLQTSLETMPVEDATIPWPESESPYRTVALLRLPQQEIATANQSDQLHRMAFDIWNGLAAHCPLGGINRLRREVYPLSAAWRNQQFPVTPQEET